VSSEHASYVGRFGREWGFPVEIRVLFHQLGRDRWILERCLVSDIMSCHVMSCDEQSQSRESNQVNGFQSGDPKKAVTRVRHKRKAVLRCSMWFGPDQKKKL
jgi:hypothetical protein